MFILRIAIIDDDPTFANYLNNHLETLCKNKQIAYNINIVEPQDALEFHDSLVNYDLIFLDIEMPNISGIELSAKINKLKGSNETPFIIFVSGKDNLVFDALSTFPYSFVRKSHMDDAERCLYSVYNKLTESHPYRIKVGREIKTLEVRDIIYLEKQNNYTAFFTAHEVYYERCSISNKYQDLKPLGFLRPSIGHLVNAAHITKITGSFVSLSCDKELPIGRKYKTEFKSEFNNWLIENNHL